MRIDPDQPVDNFRTLAEVRSASLASPTLTATLLGLFGLLALVITAAGIAGVVAFSVNQRTQEFGIRMALGAARRNVLSHGAAPGLAAGRRRPRDRLRRRAGPDASADDAAVRRRPNRRPDVRRGVGGADGGCADGVPRCRPGGLRRSIRWSRFASASVPTARPLLRFACPNRRSCPGWFSPHVCSRRSPVLIASTGAGQTGRQGGGQNPPPRGGRGDAPVRDARPAEAAPPGTSSITGTIVVAGTGAPARRARVTLSGEALRGGRSVTSDDQGRYAFGALPPGRYTLSASKVGHLSVTYGQRVPGSGRPGTPIQLDDGQRLTIRLQMPRGGVISGTVLDEHGEAVPGTQVRAFRFSMQGGVRTLQQAASDATDDRGCTASTDCRIGDYLVGARHALGPPGTARSPIGSRKRSPRCRRRVARSASRPLPRCWTGSAPRRRARGQSRQDEPTTGYAPVFYPGTRQRGNATAVR